MKITDARVFKEGVVRVMGQRGNSERNCVYSLGLSVNMLLYPGGDFESLETG